MADPLSAAGFALADTLFATGATGAITGLTGTGAMLASGLASSVISRKAGKAAGQVVAKPTAMPTRDSDAVRAAAQRRIASMQARAGRASTIFTGDDDKLGG